MRSPGSIELFQFRMTVFVNKVITVAAEGFRGGFVESDELGSVFPWIRGNCLERIIRSNLTECRKDLHETIRLIIVAVFVTGVYVQSAFAEFVDGLRQFVERFDQTDDFRCFELF